MQHLHDEEQEDRMKRRKKSAKKRSFGAKKNWTLAERKAFAEKMKRARAAKSRFGAVPLEKSEAAPAKKSAKKAAKKKAAPKKAAAKKAAPKKATAKKAAPKKSAAKKAKPKNVPKPPKAKPRKAMGRSKGYIRPTTPLIPPHAPGSGKGFRAGRPCLKCGEAHTQSEHWSHLLNHSDDRTGVYFKCKKGGYCDFDAAGLVRAGKKGDKSSARAAKRLLEIQAVTEKNPDKLLKMRSDYIALMTTLGEKFPVKIGRPRPSPRYQ